MPPPVFDENNCIIMEETIEPDYTPTKEGSLYII